MCSHVLCCCIYTCILHVGGAGCWFGEYKSENNDVKVWVPGITEVALRGVDCQLRCKDLCRKLVELVFTEEELRQGNATEARTPGVSLLDQTRLYAIRGLSFDYGKSHLCIVAP